MKASDLDVAAFWVTLIGTIATVAALIVAIVTILHQARALREQNAERAADEREREERRRRAQAECLSAQLHLDPERSFRSDQPPAYYAQVNVFNASQLPFYDVVVLSPSVDHPGHVYRSQFKILAGGQEDHAHTPAQSTRALEGEPVDIHFRDAAGVRWHRTPAGDLHEIGADHPSLFDEDLTQD